ncbi:MBL fold metallo-hydrolase [Nakamurella sp. YIM 132087]|uniref:MBL fold metallo-hydrolase n=1 Tax=Nakamurella alba TaxID=2665158 RepID=A0A7K1FH30_9ACTN|nr:MBL fold metallo-hydrolase [Nakamurella alba]MTD13437.1 MBL fold metallo-hydrolase [Nakamurella alba]
MTVTTDWRTPGTFEVATGVHRIPMPMSDGGLDTVNVYALIAPDGITLIDGGEHVPGALDRLAAGLAPLGAGIADVRRVLVTHVHVDHYSLAPSIRRISGAEVAMGAGEQPTIQRVGDPDFPQWSEQHRQLRRGGAGDVLEGILAGFPGMESDPADYLPPDTWWTGPTDIPLGDAVLQVIPTPGHTAGHSVFALPGQGLMFTGDHVLPRITPSIGFDAAPAVLPLRSFLASLALVRSGADHRMLPAHGPVTDSVHHRIDELVAHHDVRLAETAAAVRGGASSAREVAAQLGWTRHLRRFDELTVFNRMLAVCETLAHLDLLVDRGELTVTEDEGISRYA